MAQRSFWRHVDAETRRVQNVDAKASAAQARYLLELDRKLPRSVVYSTYQRMTGTAYMARRPDQRYSKLDRLTASDLINAYKTQIA